LGGFGDGGMITTNDDELYELLLMLRKHGGKNKYNANDIGYNARLDTVQAAVLLGKLENLDNMNKRRRAVAKNYNELLKDVSWVKTPHEHPKAFHVYHQYTIRVLNRKRVELQNKLKANGVNSMIYYPVLLTDMEVFKNDSLTLKPIKASIEAVNQILSLPISPLLTEEEVSKIVFTLTSKI